jgi:serine beta-lactamase-like protein LACTB
VKLLLRTLAGIAVLIVALTAAVLVYVYGRLESLPPGEAPEADELADARLRSVSTRTLGKLETQRAEAGWPSISMAVGFDGKLIWAGAVGFADVGTERPVRVQDRYRVGDVAKSLTAVALGQLIDEGRLHVDSIVTELVDFPAKRGPFTVGELASHTAGIRHYHDGIDGLRESFQQTQYEDVRAGLTRFAGDPLLFDPGTDFLYSSYGYNLLAAALEAADGRDYLSLMQARVFDPAAMTATSAEHPPGAPAPPDALVTPYLSYERMLLRAPAVNNSYGWAPGGFISTPSDLVRFGLRLLDGTLVSEATRDVLWTVARLNDGTPSPGSYGFGFRVGTDAGRTLISHSGSSVGGSSYFFLYPDAGLVGAVVVNLTAPEGADGFRETVRELAWDFMTAAATFHVPGGADPDADAADDADAALEPEVAGDPPPTADPGASAAEPQR